MQTVLNPGDRVTYRGKTGTIDRVYPPLCNILMDGDAEKYAGFHYRGFITRLELVQPVARDVARTAPKPFALRVRPTPRCRNVGRCPRPTGWGGVKSFPNRAEQLRTLCAPMPDRRRCELEWFVNPAKGEEIAIGYAPEIDTVFWDMPERTP